MRLRRSWEPTDADLLAYVLDDLDEARSADIAEHLEHCADCRQRLAALQQALRSLEQLPGPVLNVAPERDMLKARLRMEAAGRQVRPAGGWTQRVWTGIRNLIGVAPGLAPSSEPSQIIRADTSSAIAGPSVLPPRPEIDPTRLSFAPIAPETLPGSNHLVEATAFASGSFEARYEGARGLRLLITQELATTEEFQSSEKARSGKIQVGDAEALVIIDDALNSVTQLSWNRGGMRFVLRALHAEEDAFPLKEAIQIAERLMESQDNVST